MPFFHYPYCTKKIFYLLSILYLSSCYLPLMAQTQIILSENFDNCQLAAGWQNIAESGAQAWSLGQDTENWTQSMDGTCMVYFNDYRLGPSAAASRAMLISPTFDGTQNANIILETDFHFRDRGSSSLSFLIFDGISYRTLATYTRQDYAGTVYSAYDHAVLDLSPYRAPNNHIAIVFDDAGEEAWWAAIDNFSISGNGFINDDCSRVFALGLNVPCTTPYSNINAIFTGEQASCATSSDAAVWFVFQAPADGAVNIVTSADFNELITVFSGFCYALTPIACTNFDEFGFINETMRLNNLTIGQTYYLRVSGVTNSFGASEGNFCIEIQSQTQATPNYLINDELSSTILLGVDSLCTNGTNKGATLSENEPIPSRNSRSRASVWYRFIAPELGSVFIQNDADFADVITVYEGSDLDNLTEIGCSDYGRTLQVNDLNPGDLYYVQISSYFATVEGNFCLNIQNVTPAPLNEVCTQAINLDLDADCTEANNKNAHFVGDLADVILPFHTYHSSTLTGNYYTRPEEYSTCVLSTRSTQYDTFVFMTDSTAEYTIHNTYSPTFDGYLHLYSDTFDPQNPCNSYVAGNHHFNGSPNESSITTILTAGTPYYVVTSAWQPYQAGTYSTNITGVGNISLLQYQANINGMLSTCDYKPDAPVWFSFVAPESGKVRIASHTDFPHILSLYSGICGNLHEVSCAYNPSACDDAPFFSDLIAGETYFVQVASAFTPFGYSYGDICINVKTVNANPICVKVKAFLEGCYQGSGTMRNTLNDYKLISEKQPYNTAPWYYEGEECSEITPEHAVDWVMVELRDPNDNNIIIAQKAALIYETGNIKDPNKEGVCFDVPTGDYYITLRHRNHLAVMSSVAVPLPNMNAYSFAAGNEYVLGNAQLKDLGDGYYALLAGDVDANGVITVSDLNEFVQNSSLINVYTSSDVNLDRIVSVNDFNKYQPNASKIGIAQIRY